MSRISSVNPFNLGWLSCVLEPNEVDYYLPEFRLYLETYRKMIDKVKPTGEDISFYQDFDTYMKKLDPILGYMSSNFGEDNANLMMDEFFFPYAI